MPSSEFKGKKMLWSLFGACLSPRVCPVSPRLSPQSSNRGVMLLGILKMLPRFLVGLLIRSRLLPRLCPFSRLASRNLKEVVDGLTPNPELRAVLSYMFPTYGR